MCVQRTLHPQTTFDGCGCLSSIESKGAYPSRPLSNFLGVRRQVSELKRKSVSPSPPPPFSLVRYRGSYDAPLIYFMITCVFSLRPVGAWTYIRNKTCYVKTDDYMKTWTESSFWCFLLKPCFRLFSESIITKMLHYTLMYGKQNKVCNLFLQAIT